MDRQKSMILSRVLAIILCLACIFASFSAFFNTISGNSEDSTSITITFTQGSDCQLLDPNDDDNTTIFSNVTVSVPTNASGCLVVPETYFDIGDNYNASSGETKIAISSTMTGTPSTYILDCETFYLYSTSATTSGWYSFTGWKISSATQKIPEQTVFQPGDVITSDIITKYASDGTLTLEALWGKCYFIQNAYTTMVYSNTLSGSAGYYELDTTNSQTYGETGASDDNAGTDPKEPKATIDGLYSTLRSGSTAASPHRDYDAYATVIMLTGDLDYYKDSNRSLSGAYVYYRYYGYGYWTDANASVNNGVSANEEYVSATYISANEEYVSATYKSLQATRTYNSTDGTATITYSSSTRGTKYSYNYKGYSSYNYAYGNFRFDNILFKRIDSTLYDGKYSSEFRLYYPSGDGGLHYFETTARYNIYYEGDVLTQLNRYSSPMSTLWAHNHEYIVLNGGDFAYVSYTYTEDSSITERYWYFGRFSSVTGSITGGTTASGATNCTTTKGKLNITVTGGNIGSLWCSSGSLYAISVGARAINVYGNSTVYDSAKSKLINYEYNPCITNLYGGGYVAPLYGDIELNINGCTNIENIYGGGNSFTAITYGDVTLTIKNSKIPGNVYGGGQYANVEKITETYTQYTYASSTLSSSTANISNLGLTYSENTGGNVKVNISATTVSGTVYGSGMGQTQTLEARGSGSPITISYVGQGAADSSSGEYSEDDYPADWEKEPEYSTYDSSTGYILIGAYKNISWVESTSSVYFYTYNTFAYLSLATVESVVINITDGSTIKGDVYGGGSIAQVLGSTEVNITDSTVTGTVYGGGDGTTIPSGVTLYAKSDNYVAPRYEVTSITSGISVTITGSYSKLDDAFAGLATYTYTWSNESYLLGSDYNGIDTTNKLLYSANMSDLGSVKGSTTVNISGKSTVDTVYGGGNEGAVGGNTTVNIESNDNGSPTITNVYGGGNAADVAGNITVTVKGGTITTLYGGCNAANVGGAISVTITGGKIGTLYGGNNASGTISGTITIKISQDTNSTTEITTLYGGGNKAAYSGENTSIVITVSGGSVGTLYGGGYGTTAETTSTSISATGGSITGSVYGGGYAGAVNGSTSVTLSVSVGGSIYGGGYEGNVSGSTTVTTSGAVTGDIYGGGYEGNVTGAASVTISGGSAANVYGGGYKGTAGSAKVTVSAGSISGNVYGGGNEGAVGGAITVEVSGGTISGELYGGCNAANVGGDITVTVTGGTITTLYGGNNASGNISGTITVNISQDTSSTTQITTLYGGGNLAEYKGTSTTVTVSGGTIGTLYGGGNKAAVTATYVTLSGGSVTGSIYGGGYQGNVSGATTVSVSGGTVTGGVFGGGYDGDIGSDSSTASTTVTVTGGTIASVYGGGYNGDIYGKTNVTVSSSSTATIISGSVYGAGYGADAGVTKGTTVTIDLSYNFTPNEALTDSTSTSGEVKTTITEDSTYTSVISGSVYGGGNLGTVGEGTINTSTNTASVTSAATTTVNIISGHIEKSVYGGGYGVPESGTTYSIYMGTVFGSTSVSICGDDSNDYIYIEGNVFGGGSQSRVYSSSSGIAAAVAISSKNGCSIALGTSASTSVGSVFGGGERGNAATTNASVATTVGNVSVSITGNGESSPATIYFVSGGVYGDGNLCLVSGTRTITITNFITDGKDGTLKTFYSLQRADEATLSNTKIVLLGATDLVAEGDSTTYSINRITTLNLTNGSTIKLDRIVNYLGALTSDVYSERTFVNHGYNGSNSYNKDAGYTVNALDSQNSTETENYITSALASGYVTGTYYANTVCVANGLSLELRTTDGNYGTVTGLFTLSLLREVEGEGGGFVYADITNSTGDFICITKYSATYTQDTTVTSTTFSSGIYYTLNNGTYEQATEYAEGTTYYVKTEGTYMTVVDDVGGYKNGAYTYYYWYIQGSTINYTLEVTGYIGSTETDYNDSATIPQHTAARYYVLHGLSIGTALETAITGKTYELVYTDESLSGIQISIELMIGSTSLGFLYYNSTSEKWGIYQDTNKIYYGITGTSMAADNILASALEVDNENDTIYFVLHKSTDVATETSLMELTVTIDIHEENDTQNGIGDAVSNGTSKLIVAGTANIVRLVPTQTIYKATGKNYAGVFTDNDITITEGSSFTVQYVTKYIPAAFPSSSGSVTWAITAAGYSYYSDGKGNYMTLETTASDTTCTSISSLLTYIGETAPASGWDTYKVYSDGDGYCYYTSASSNDKVEMKLDFTPIPLSTIPVGTKITMVDLTSGTAEYYYYNCDEANTTYTTINLDDFKKMGTETTISDLGTTPSYKAAYNGASNVNSQVTEYLIFIFDFSEVEDYNSTSSFSVHLQHLYKATNGNGSSTDMMDFLQSTTTDGTTTYKRLEPVLTEYTISSEAGYKFYVNFNADSYYDLDTAELTVTITEDETNINTRLAEYEYAIKIELIVGSEVKAFPVGMLFKYEGTPYAIAADGTYVIIPVKTSGTHTISIINELYSLKAIAGDTAYFRVTLYSAPDASYYNYIEWSSATASYGISTNLTYALSVTPTTTTTTSTDESGNTVTTTTFSSQVLTAGDALNFTLKTYCSSTSDEKVTVTLMKKSDDKYVTATLGDLFTDTNIDSLAVSTDGQDYSWAISDSATTGTYRLVFTYGDHVEYLNVIVY